jgi:hypothetical protein
LGLTLSITDSLKISPNATTTTTTTTQQPKPIITQSDDNGHFVGRDSSEFLIIFDRLQQA